MCVNVCMWIGEERVWNSNKIFHFCEYNNVTMPRPWENFLVKITVMRGIIL